VIAISKSTDPTAGFWTYYFDDPFHGATGWQAGDTADYDALGVGPTVYLATANWNSSSGSKGAQAMMFDANAMANGQANPWWWIFWNWTDANGANLYVIQPAVHHGSTGSANTVWFAEKSGNSAQLFHVDNPMQANQAAFLWNTSLTGTSPSGLVDGPQAGVTNPSPPPLGMGAQIGDAFLKAAWRNNKVYLSANSTMNSNGTNLSAGRVILIVRSVAATSLAICLLRRPATTSVITSRSRAVSRAYRSRSASSWTSEYSVVTEICLLGSCCEW